MQQVLTETLVLASIGGALGVLVAFWVSRLLMLSPAVRFALRGQSLFSTNVLVFACGITLLAALLCGAIPALRVARVDLTATLRRTSGRADSDRMRRLFVISEVAVSLALLVGAGLLTRSLLRIVNRPFGFDPSNLTIVEADGNAAGMQSNEFADQVSRRLERIPGVTAVAVMSELPVSGEATTGGFVLEGSDERDQAKWPYAIWHVVNDDYFRTLGVPIVRGRGFRPSDVGGPSAVIDHRRRGKTFLAWRRPDRPAHRHPRSRSENLRRLSRRQAGLDDDRRDCRRHPQAREPAQHDAGVVRTVLAAAARDAPPLPGTQQTPRWSAASGASSMPFTRSRATFRSA